MTLLCYSTYEGPAPPPPPPPYDVPAYLPVVATLDSGTGALTAVAWPCTEFIPGFYAVEVDLAVQLDKNGAPAPGTITVIEDWTAPFDCADGEQATGDLTLTPLAQSHDEDLDGCADWEELGSAPGPGGLRDPFNVWDFFDTPDPFNLRDKAITVADIARVVGRFGTTGDPNIDPLSPPPATGYHTAFDRGATQRSARLSGAPPVEEPVKDEWS